MRRILIIPLLILIIAVVIIISVNIRETDPSRASTEELIEILVDKDISVVKKSEVLTAISQRELYVPIIKLVQFINDTDDSSETNLTAKIDAINLLLKDTTAESIIAVANLLKTQSNLEIRNHIVNILSNKALEKEISSALIEALSQIRSSDALLIMSNRFAIFILELRFSIFLLFYCQLLYWSNPPCPGIILFFPKSGTRNPQPSCF